MLSVSDVMARPWGGVRGQKNRKTIRKFTPSPTPGLSLKTQFPGQMPCSEIFRGGSCHVQRLAEQQSKMSRSYREAARWEYGLGVKCNLTIIL